MEKLILASASPRRRELLERMGAVFEVRPAKGEEIVTKKMPQDVVTELALQKAREVASGLTGQERAEGRIVLGADTVVSWEGQILGKPRDTADAVRMLSMLSGNTHSVYTGVAVIYGKGQEWNTVSFYEETQVRMYPMSQEEITSYAATGDPLDKAGAYAIQGKCGVHVAGISGDYNNVVGLPVARIYQELKKVGIEIFGNS